MIGFWWLAAAEAADPSGRLGTTEALAVTALDHGAWAGCVGIAVGGEDGGLACSAVATHVAILTTPIFLTRLEPEDAAGRKRLGEAWGLYWVGVGVTALGWAAVGWVDEDAGPVVMTLADVALIGTSALAVQQLVSDPAGTPIVPVLSGSF